MLNDQRERTNEHVPHPANQAATIPLDVQEQLDALQQVVQKIAENKSYHMEYDRRKGTPFITRISIAEIPSKMSVLTNYTEIEDHISQVNKFEM